MLAHLDTSAFNWAVDKGLTGDDLHDLLRRAGFQPGVSLRATYELARTLIRHPDRGASLFTVFRDSRLRYGPGADLLLPREIAKARTLRTGRIDTSLPADQRVLLDEHVQECIRGHLTADARRFITQHEQEYRRLNPAHFAEYRGHVDRVKANKAARGASLDMVRVADMIEHFEGRGELRDWIQGHIERHGGGRGEAGRIARRLAQFPAINATLHANAKIMLHFVLNPGAPGMDRVPDYRMVAEAAYAGAFISNDRGQLAAGPDIAAHLTFVPIGDL